MHISKNKIVPMILIATLIVYCLAFSKLSVRNHELYQTFAWDLGFFDQLLWQASSGRLNFVSSIGNINLVGDHFQPILFLITPLYWLWNDVRVILIAQTIIIASAAVPLYLLAKKKFEMNHFGANEVSDRVLPFLISAGYLLFHGTQFTVTNEFHQSAFIPLFLSLGFYFIETGKTKKGIVSLLILLLVREETALLIFGIGLMYLVRHRIKLGISLAIVGIISFFLLVLLIIPRISSQGGYIHLGYGEIGVTPVEVVKNILQDPLKTLRLLFSPKEKIAQVRNSLLAFAGLPLLSPALLIPVGIQYAVRFIDTRNIHRWLDMNHYAASVGPLLAVATIQTISKMKSRIIRRSMMAVLIIGIVGTNVLVHAPIFSLMKSQLYFTPQWVRDDDALITSVPKDSAIAANNSLVPHLSHRDKIYLLPDINNAEYIAVDLSDGPNKYAPFGYERMREYIDMLINNGLWVEEEQIGQSILLKRNANN